MKNGHVKKLCTISLKLYQQLLVLLVFKGFVLDCPEGSINFMCSLNHCHMVTNQNHSNIHQDISFVSIGIVETVVRNSSLREIAVLP